MDLDEIVIASHQAVADAARVMIRSANMIMREQGYKPWGLLRIRRDRHALLGTLDRKFGLVRFASW